MDYNIPLNTLGGNMVYATLSPFFQNKRQVSADIFLQIHILFRGRPLKVYQLI